MSRQALVLGATGLVGRHCLHRLCGHPDYDAVTVLSRRPLDEVSERARVEVTDLDAMEDYSTCFAVDDVICCLGTTRHKAGSRAAFEYVDHELCVRAARLAARAGARNFLMVSAVNADAGSRWLYPRTKGRAEVDASAAGVMRTHFFRPSLLLGDRGESRPAEWLGIQAMRAVRPALHACRFRLAPIEAQQLAGAMVSVARSDRAPGLYRYLYGDLLDWSRG